MAFMAMEIIQFMKRSVRYHTFETINVRKELVRKMMKTFVIQAIYADNKSETPGEALTVKWKT